LDKIRPDPSDWRSTTAAAVSSQVVSIPSTRFGLPLSNLKPLIQFKTLFQPLARSVKQAFP
jgi:hypothetical protein